MGLSRVTVWTAGQVLTAADLNAEFNNALNNPIALISPTTGDINYASNQAILFRLENLAADPATVAAGRIWYQTAKQQPQIDDGTVIRTIPALVSTNLTQGDLIISASSGSGAFKPLTIGTAGQSLVVTSSGGVVGWGTPAVASGGNYMVSGLQGTVTSSNSASFEFNFAQLRSSAGTATFQMNATSSFTISLALVGVGGKDQAGNFASTFVHCYVVSTGANSTTPIGVVSSVPPPTGPTLPSSCAAWAYLATVLYSSTSTVFGANMNVAGNQTFYSSMRNLLTAGTGTTETSVAIGGVVPPGAVRFRVIANRTGGTVAKFRVDSSKDMYSETAVTNEATIIELPNVGQSLYYILNLNTNGQYIDIMSYTVPNGDV